MSLSMPKTCRIDTFMSGTPATASVAVVIKPPQPRDYPRRESGYRSDRSSPPTEQNDAAPRKQAQRPEKVRHSQSVAAVGEPVATQLCSARRPPRMRTARAGLDP